MIFSSGTSGSGTSGSGPPAVQRWRICAVLACVLALGTALGPPASAAATAPQVVRAYGESRWLTAVAVSQYAHPNAATVYLATGRDYPDALAAAAAAGNRGPVLLVGRDVVPDAVRRELIRLRPGRIVVVGSERVISDAVLTSVRHHGSVTVRRAGSSRYGTAAALSADRFAPGVPTAYVATGADFPDALSGSAAAGRTGGPLLLTSGSAVPGATLAELRRLRPGRIAVLGSAAAVSPAVEAALRTVAPTVRLSGQSRWETAAAISRGSGPASTVVLATGRDFPDAAVAGAAAARWNAPLLLSDAGGLPPSTAAELRRLRPSRVVVLGSATALSTGVTSAVRRILGSGTTYRAVTPMLPAFAAQVRRVDAATLQRMTYTHRSGCPVEASDLRLLDVTYLGFDGDAHTGEMVMHRAHAGAAVQVFRALYEGRFRIQRMVLVDAYQGSDARSMAANNTSGYNCRRTTSGSTWSEHAYGRAIDINPVQNPYVRGSTVLPAAGRAYVSRASHRPGMILPGDVVTRAFAAQGWKWGGDYRSLKDYQHFSSTGR